MGKKVVFLGMGGTIAGTAPSAGDNVGYTAAQVGVQQLLQAAPGVAAALGGHEALAEQVCQIDSKDLAYADWDALVKRLTHWLQKPEVAGVVVTHGTDTLEETAYLLSRAVPSGLLTHKPVVLTCAMRPASSQTPDGPGNLADAVAVTLCGRVHGVVVVCAGKVHSAVQVQKVHPYRVDAFDSGEAGPLGLVEEGRVRMLSGAPIAEVGLPAVDMGRLQAQGWPRVELVISHAGASGALVRALLTGPDAAVAALRGIVVAGTGNGTIHKDMERALEEAQQQGVRIVRTSRCAYGQVVGGSPSERPGSFATSTLSALKARIALMLEIAAQA